MHNGLIVFANNAEKGKVKTSLAKVIGEDKSLEVHKFLLQHTRDIAVSCKYALFVFYSNYIHVNDVFDDDVFSKHKQDGSNAGERMLHAFNTVHKLGIENICLIGCDCYDLTTDLLQQAFDQLNEKQVVIGPTNDGEHYLLGMKEIHEVLFKNNEVSGHLVLENMFKNIEEYKLSVATLSPLNNINTIEDLLETNILTKLKEDV